MANKNDFKAFALDPNANVLSQANWEALPALLSGFTAGKASSAQVNKAIRQATTIGALVGQFIANAGVDALDNGDVNGLVTKFTNALTKNLGLGASAFGYKNMTVFPSAGVSQWTVPDEIKAGRKCLVEVYGGGASGGRSAAGGGGGAGGVAIKLLTLTGVNSVTVTVGAGGAAAAIDTTVVSGNSGGTSSFGSYLSATGGGGSVSSGGTGGTGTGGDINTSLGSGCAGSSFGADYSSGSGGGPGGSGSIASQRRDGVGALGPGGGGSGSAIGSSGIAAKPGKGNPGMVVIRW